MDNSKVTVTLPYDEYQRLKEDRYRVDNEFHKVFATDMIHLLWKAINIHGSINEAGVLKFISEEIPKGNYRSIKIATTNINNKIVDVPVIDTSLAFPKNPPTS